MIYEIVGIDESILFQTMDRIANAVSDSCAPQIVPKIQPHTIEGKTIIVVTVDPEPQRPYYLKSKGKEKGTYIRVGTTTRLASAEKIKALEMEGARISWDELTCVGYKVTEKAVKKLCRDMNGRRKSLQERGSTKEKRPMVTKTTLENWNLLKRKDDSYLASNAFVLLTSSHFPFAKIQCAVFKGKDRAVFLDKPEFIELPETFRVNLYRKQLAPTYLQKTNRTTVNDIDFSTNDGNTVENDAYVSANGGNIAENVGVFSTNGGNIAENVGDIKSTILKLLTDDNKTSAAKLAKTLSISQRTVERHLHALREKGLLVRHGSSHGGYWEVTR